MELGKCIVDALSYSRLVLPEPRDDVWVHPDTLYDKELYDKSIMKKNYLEWVTMLMSKFNYKNEKQIYKNLHYCSIEATNENIIMMPTHHVKLDYWNGDGFTDADNITIPIDSKPEAIGAALRLTFSRCTS
ncbi:hypothetical protein Sant_1282 [Sodalis praecaptivus]|uniref:DUF1436 family protein n=1 Tax=Sodalis praecaptivus TaxID=1239307 RepID=W0HRD0_9GAMM|nr:hypothetical protein Sant_1282 [Sodalis praecaptivus]